MIEIQRPINIHSYYHAHVYFDSHTMQFASDLCAQAGKLFKVDVGRVHQKPVGPHPKWSCQISFSEHEFKQLIPWLSDNRAGLTILVHAQTGNNLKDHTDYAYWLGDSIQLNLSIFTR